MVFISNSNLSNSIFHFNSISCSGIWIELQFQFWNWINPTLHAMAWHWTGDKSLSEPMVTTILSLNGVTRQVKVSSEPADQRRQLKVFNLLCMKLVLMACTTLVTSHYLNQWWPEFCHHIESSGLNTWPVNQGDSPVLTSWDPCCQHTQYELFQ